MAEQAQELVVPDVGAWRAWLAEHVHEQAGVWLLLAKKGTTEPTSLRYDEAVLEALCFGWIDGQSIRRDAATYAIRFTHRRARSIWSQRNVELVGGLVERGLMQPAGQAEIDRAMADGRWEAAYAGPATITVPDDLTAAIRGDARAAAMFAILTSQNRYAILHRINQIKGVDARARRIEQYVAMLARGETLYRQRRSREK